MTFRERLIDVAVNRAVVANCRGGVDRRDKSKEAATCARSVVRSLAESPDPKRDMESLQRVVAGHYERLRAA